MAEECDTPSVYNSNVATCEETIESITDRGCQWTFSHRLLCIMTMELINLTYSRILFTSNFICNTYCMETIGDHFAFQCACGSYVAPLSGKPQCNLQVGRCDLETQSGHAIIRITTWVPGCRQWMKLDVAGSSYSYWLPRRLSPLVASQHLTPLTVKVYSMNRVAIVHVFI